MPTFVEITSDSTNKEINLKFNDAHSPSGSPWINANVSVNQIGNVSEGDGFVFVSVGEKSYNLGLPQTLKPGSLPVQSIDSVVPTDNHDLFLKIVALKHI